jgi:hypothetical protein
LRCLIGVLARLAATLVAVGEAPPSQTDGLTLQLTWQSPQGCPDLASERAEIRRRVGDLDRSLRAEPIAAEGAIRADGAGGYRLSLRTRVGEITGERVLAGPDCRELAEAAALVLALLINPEATAVAEPAPAQPAPLPPPSPPPNTPSPVARGSGVGVGLGAVLASGVLPGSAAGLAARVFYQRGFLAGAFEITGFLPDEQSAPVLPGASASFYRLESLLQICASTPSDRRLGAALCLGGAVVRLHGQSAGVSDPGQTTAYWPEALLAGSGQLRLTAATRLRLAADLHGLGSRPDFAILGLGSVYRPAAYNMRGTLGLDVLF